MRGWAQLPATEEKKFGSSISRLMGVEITIVGDTLLCGLAERY